MGHPRGCLAHAWLVTCLWSSRDLPRIAADPKGAVRALLLRSGRGLGLGPSAARRQRAIKEHARIAVARLVGLGAQAQHGVGARLSSRPAQDPRARLYLNVYQPLLQTPGGLHAVFCGEGVLYIGKIQEKARVPRTRGETDPVTGFRTASLYFSTAMVNAYYIYFVDEDFGPCFLNFCSYLPSTARLCQNGHEYAKPQLRQRGIEFEALDDGIRRCADPATLQAICARSRPSASTPCRSNGWRGCRTPSCPGTAAPATFYIGESEPESASQSATG